MPPVLPQYAQDERSHRNITITSAFALLDMDHHSLTVDIGHLQPSQFGLTNTAAIEKYQDGAMHQSRCSLDHSDHFLWAEAPWVISSVFSAWVGRQSKDLGV
jgi:hypothetical protein